MGDGVPGCAGDRRRPCPVADASGAIEYAPRVPHRWRPPSPMSCNARRSTVPSIEVRPFKRPDREQLTALVNAHIEAVLPGVSVSVNAVLSQLEREPEEAIVDPWAVERTTLVAV